MADDTYFNGNKMVLLRTGQLYDHYATDTLCCETAKSYLWIEPQYLDLSFFSSRIPLYTNVPVIDG